MSDSQALGDLSSTNAFTSAGVGDKTVRSKYARRTNVIRSASGCIFQPFCSSLASTKASIGVRTWSLFFTAGGVAFTGLRKDHHSRLLGVILAASRAKVAASESDAAGKRPSSM